MLVTYRFIKHQSPPLLPEKSSSRIRVEVTTTEPSLESKLSGRDAPVLRRHIPVTHISPHQLERHLLSLARLEPDLVESTQLARRGTRGRGIRESDIQLRDGVAVHTAGIAHLRGECVHGIPESGVATRLDRTLLRQGSQVRGHGLSSDQLGQVVSSVTETEAKLVADGDVVGVKVAVSDFELLVEPALPVVGAVGSHSSGKRGVVVRFVVGDHVGQLGGGVGVAVEEVGDGVTSFLAGVVGGQDGGDVGVIGEGEDVDAGGVGDNDGVVAVLGDGFDDGVAVPIEGEVGAVDVLLGPGLEEDETDVGLFGVPEFGHGFLRDEGVVEPGLHPAAVLAGSGRDGVLWGREVTEAAGAGAASVSEDTVFEVGLGGGALGVGAGVVADDDDVTGLAQGEDIALVLQQDGGGGTVLADHGAVVAADVTVTGARELPVVEPGVGGRVDVQGTDGGVDAGVVLVLAEPEVGGHDAHDHVIDAVGGDGAVVDGFGEVLAEVGSLGPELTVDGESTGHGHVHAALCGGNTTVSGTPIGHDVALEAQLGLEEVVEEVGVLARVGAVDTVVGAHEAGDASAGGVGEGPHVDLVKGAVIEVGGDGVLDIGCGVGIRSVGRVTLRLLLVGNKVLCIGLHTGVLDTENGLLHADTSQVRIGCEAFPGTSVIGTTAERTTNGAEDDVGALALVLCSHGIASVVEQFAIPTSSGRHTTDEDARVVTLLDALGTVLQTETTEVEAGDGQNVAHTRARLTCGHPGLLLDCELRYPVLGLGHGLFPAALALGFSCDKVSMMGMVVHAGMVYLREGNTGGEPP